jgi:hypothetical protein
MCLSEDTPVREFYNEPAKTEKMVILSSGKKGEHFSPFKIEVQIRSAKCTAKSDKLKIILENVHNSVDLIQEFGISSNLNTGEFLESLERHLS